MSEVENSVELLRREREDLRYQRDCAVYLLIDMMKWLRSNEELTERASKFLHQISEKKRGTS